MDKIKAELSLIDNELYLKTDNGIIASSKKELEIPNIDNKYFKLFEKYNKKIISVEIYMSKGRYVSTTYDQPDSWIDFDYKNWQAIIFFPEIKHKFSIEEMKEAFSENNGTFEDFIKKYTIYT